MHYLSEFKESSGVFAPKLTYILVLYISLKSLFVKLQSFEERKVLTYFIVSIFIVEGIYILAQKTDLIVNTNPLFPIGGSFGHPGYSATLLGLLILFLFSNFNLFGKNIHIKFILWSCFFMSLGFSLYTLSRTGILLNLAALTLYITSLLSNKSKQLTITGIIMLIVAVSLAQFKENSSNGRLFIWKNSLKLLQDAPLLGYGTDSFSAKYSRQQTLYFSKGFGTEKEKYLSDYILQAYNEFIEVTIEMGYIGTILLALFFTMLFIEAKREKSIIRTSPLVLGYAFTMCFWSLFRELPFLLTFFTLIAVSKAKENQKKEKRRMVQFLGFCFFLFITLFTARDIYDTYQFKKNSSLGNKSLKERKFENAARYFQKAIEYRKSQVLIVKYSIALNLSGKDNEAIEFLKSISETYYSPDYLLLLGDLNFQNKKYAVSERYYIEAHHNVPSKLTPLYKLSKAFIFGNKKNEADSLVNIFLHLDPKVNSTTAIAMKEELRYLINKMDSTKVKY
tara:strand:+ start:31039 stop:32559 length:1521 start_codon:yes stop_codon:yes gene_type:complete